MSSVLLEPADLTELRNHWWWRPGWQLGRRFYACHLTFEGERGADLRRLVSEYQTSLTSIAGIDLIPAQWLHLTMQGVGFADEVSDKTLSQLSDALRTRLATVNPFSVQMTTPTIGAEAITLRVTDPEPVCALRLAVHEAIAAVRGDEAPALADQFKPHVSLAYISQPQPVETVRKALADRSAAPATVRVSAVPLLEYHRDNRMYQWRTLERIPLDGA